MWTAFPRMTSEDVLSLHTRSHTCAYTHVCVHTQMCTRTRPHEKLKSIDGWNSPAGSFYSKAWKSRLSSSGAGDGLWVGGGGLGESCSFAHSRTIYFLVTRRNVRSTRRWALNGYLKTAQDNFRAATFQSPRQPQKFQPTHQPRGTCNTGAAFVFWEPHRGHHKMQPFDLTSPEPYTKKKFPFLQLSRSVALCSWQPINNKCMQIVTNAK